MTKQGRLQNVRKRVSSTNGTGNTGHSNGKKMKLNHSLTSNTKKLKMDWRPKCETRHYNALIGKQAKHSLT